MKIHFAFPDKKIYFNCEKCNGTCCNINGNLLFSEKQIHNIQDFNLLKNNVSKVNGIYNLKCGKRCWFLHKNRCSLDEATKPVACKLYPAIIWKINEENLICEIIPCPEMATNGPEILEYNNLKKSINNYKENLPITYHPYNRRIIHTEDSNTLIKLENEINFVNRYFNQQLSFKNEVEHMILILYPQVRFHPVIWFLNSAQKDIVQEIYFNLCRTYSLSSVGQDVYLLYSIVRNETIKRALLLFYYPWNKELYNELSISQKNILDSMKINKKSFFEYSQLQLFELFFRSNKTLWEKIQNRY